MLVRVAVGTLVAARVAVLVEVAVEVAVAVAVTVAVELLVMLGVWEKARVSDARNPCVALGSTRGPRV